MRMSTRAWASRLRATRPLGSVLEGAPEQCLGDAIRNGVWADSRHRPAAQGSWLDNYSCFRLRHRRGSRFEVCPERLWLSSSKAACGCLDRVPRPTRSTKSRQVASGCQVLAKVSLRAIELCPCSTALGAGFRSTESATKQHGLTDLVPRLLRGLQNTVRTPNFDA